MEDFDLEKIRTELSGQSAAVSRRNLGRSNLGLQRNSYAGETSLPEGEIEAIVITNDPLIGGQSPSTYSPVPSPLQTLVHLFYPIFVSELQICTCGLLSSVDYSL